MRRLAVLSLLPILACTAPDPRSVRASDLGWLAGTWRGEAADDSLREQAFSAPTDGAMRGEYRAFRDGEVIAESSMRIVSGTNGIVMMGALEGSEPRTYALTGIARGLVRFRSRSTEFPAEVTYERSGDLLRMTVRGDSGLGSLREVTTELALVR